MMNSIKNFSTKLNSSRSAGLAGRRSSSSGQGAVEFILLLVVVVSIILGTVYQFNDAFRKYTTSYFGGYLSCLLETGELPVLGAQQKGAAGECNELFEEFSLASGRPLKDKYVSKNSSGSSAAGGGSEGGPSSSSDGSSSGSSVGGGSSSRSSGSGDRFLSGRSRKRRAGAGGRGGKAGKSKKNYTGDTSTTSASWGVGAEDTITVSQVGVENYDQYGGSPDEQQKDRQAVKVVSSTKKNKVGKKNKRILISQNLLSKELPADDEPLTFGSFLRYLLIICILIAILLFFGTQALQISKSME